MNNCICSQGQLYSIRLFLFLLPATDLLHPLRAPSSREDNKIFPLLLNKPGLVIQSSHILNALYLYENFYKERHAALVLSILFFFPSFHPFPSLLYIEDAWDIVLQNQAAQSLHQSAAFFVYSFQVASKDLSIFQNHINKSHSTHCRFALSTH